MNSLQCELFSLSIMTTLTLVSGPALAESQPSGTSPLIASHLESNHLHSAAALGESMTPSITFFAQAQPNPSDDPPAFQVASGRRSTATIMYPLDWESELLDSQRRSTLGIGLVKVNVD